jgi:ClpP class serine protease
MKQLPIISTRLYASPWAILPDAHAELSALYRQYLAGTLPQIDLQAAREEYDEYTSAAVTHVREARTAVVSFSGVIAKAAPVTMSGPRFADLDHLSSALAQLATDPGTDLVILHIDSPGGQIVGLEEIAADIRDLREAGKRVVTYTDVQLCSAAYWIGAACDEIYASPSAIVGSIGTYIAALDSSRAFELQGLELKLFRDGDLKAIGHPGKVWTEAEEQYLTDMVAAAGARFKAHVRAARGPIPDEHLQGQWWHAYDAPSGIVSNLLPRNLTALIIHEKS